MNGYEKRGGRFDHPQVLDVSGDFYSTILPEGKYYSVVYMRHGRVTHTWPASPALIPQQIAAAPEGYDVYVAIASFTERRRKRDNVQLLRSLVLDIDTGKGEATFPSPEAALRAVHGHIQTGAILPPTFIVHSGGGIHLYWVLNHDIRKDHWKQLGTRLIEVLRPLDARLVQDTARTKDPAGIMRAIGSLNYKYTPPRLVAILHRGRVLSLDAVERWLDAMAGPAGFSLDDVPSTGTEGFVDQLVGDPILSAGLTLDDLAEACPQVRAAIANRHVAGYNEWRTTIQLCAWLKDAREAAHRVSQGHPEYSPEQVDAKLQNAVTERNESGVGPTTCLRYAELRNDMATCATCRYRQQVPTPVHAALKLVQQRKAKKQLANPQLESPDWWLAQLSVVLGRRVWLDNDTDVKTLSTGKTPKPVTLTPFFIVPLNELVSSTTGTIGVEWGLFEDGKLVRRTMVPVTRMDQRNIISMPTMLGLHALVSTEAASAFRTYVDAALKVLRLARVRQEVFTRLGWHDDRLCIGKLVVARDGVYRTMLMGAAADATYSQHLEPEPDRDEIAAWMRVFNAMPHHVRAAMLVSLASPLITHTGGNGGWLHLYGLPGTGKTLALRMANAVWGLRQQSVVSASSTLNALEAKLATMFNLPTTIDETTHMFEHGRPSDVVRLIMRAVNGESRERVRRDGSLIPRKFWSLAIISSANNKMTQLLSGTRDKAALMAARARLVELGSTVSRTELERMIAGVRMDVERLANATTGAVGVAVAQRMMQDGVRERLAEARQRWLLRLKGDHRFVAPMLAAMEVAGHLLEEVTGMDGKLNDLLDYMERSLAGEQEANEHLEETLREPQDACGWVALLARQAHDLVPKEQLIVAVRGDTGPVVNHQGTEMPNVVVVLDGDTPVEIRVTEAGWHMLTSSLPFAAVALSNLVRLCTVRHQFIGHGLKDPLKGELTGIATKVAIISCPR